MAVCISINCKNVSTMKLETTIRVGLATLKIVGIILCSVSIYWIYLKLTNHSPTLSDVIMNLSVGLIAAMVPFIINYFMKTSQKLERIETSIKYEFKELRKDFQTHLERYHKT